MTSVPTVYVVDDDQAMRRSTCFLLSTAGLVSKSFDSALAFLDDYEKGAPGCLILDLHMAGLSGMELLERMQAEHITLPVIVVSGTGTISLTVRGMKLGVENFLEKPAHPDVLLEKVRAALLLDAELRTKEAEIEPLRKCLSTLSKREHELLLFIVQGLPNKGIAREMEISIKTVENHRSRLMDKTKATNTADLVRMYMLLKPLPSRRT